MMREHKSATRYALLGLLAERSQSGYEIKKTFESYMSYFWNASYGQIYPDLKRLVDQGLATVKAQHKEGSPPQKIYHITAAGRKSLRSWLAKPPKARPTRSELALKLCLGRQGEVVDQLSHLSDFHEAQKSALKTLTAIEKEASEAVVDELYNLLTLRMGIALARAMADWSRAAIRTLEEAELEDSE